MINVVLLGTGNVATHLYGAFSASENVHIAQVYNHSEVTLQDFGENVDTTTSFEKLVDADIYLIALKDDAVPEVAHRLEHKKGLVAHTSGAISINAIKNRTRAGVFYPLQTFSKNQAVDLSEVPFCLEAKLPEDLFLLKRLASEISRNFYEISSAQRKQLHLAAVFTCNFVNHLYAIGETICTENNLPFEILQPLILETARKITESSPQQVQTGPAARKDKSTIDAHLNLISSQENKEIYQVLTNAIQSFHGKKL